MDFGYDVIALCETSVKSGNFFILMVYIIVNAKLIPVFIIKCTVMYFLTLSVNEINFLTILLLKVIFVIDLTNLILNVKS